MKNILWLLIIILAIACEVDEPKDPGVTEIADLLGEYQSIHLWGCSPAVMVPPCEDFVRDSVVLVTEGITESTISIMGAEFQLDKFGKYNSSSSDFALSIQNDTLKMLRRVYRAAPGIRDVETFIGVKGATSPLKAGSVGFHSASTEVIALQNLEESTRIYLDIESAKLGAAIIIEILNSSTAVLGMDYSTFPIAHDNKIVVYVMPTITSATVWFNFTNDLAPDASRNIQLQISIESVGITPSEKKNHSINIIGGDTGTPSVNKIMFTDYASSNGFYGSQLFDINSDGTGLRQRTDFSGGARSPSFSPDGKRVVFQSSEGLQYGIYTMNFDGGQVQRLTDNWGEGAPSFSPQGDKIFFVRDLTSPERSQILAMNLDGVEQDVIFQEYTEVGKVSIKDFTWSPDGKQLVYSCAKDNEEHDYRIYITEADGSNPRRLTDKFRLEERPRFSPDGKKIIFESLEPGIGSFLHLINADGTGEEKLFNGVPGLIGSQDAAWSPDSSTIIFWAEIEDNPDLTSGTFTARVDGTDFKKISDKLMLDSSWSPAK